MNALCYKTVFSKRLGALVAVGEHATSQSKGQGAGTASGAWDLGSMLRYVGVLTGVFAAASMAWSQTLPQGGRVSQGQVTISQSGQQMDITQSTSKAVVNWDSFDIGTHAKVNVVQPNSQSVLLNRVLSDNPTQILGQLQANGQVVLVNPKGIVVGSDGSVSASAFTASTLNISDADFMTGNGRYNREGNTGEVINRGRIQVAPGGYVALLGARVSNEGQIVAPQGAVALGAAETVTVPIGRTGKIKLELSPSSINASVANQKGGLIVAEGGQVYLQAAAIPSALASIVHSGSINTSAAKAGEVHLLADGGHIRVDGQITANSTGRDPQNQPQPGGDIYIGRDKDSNVLAAVGDVSGAQLESQGGFVETSGQYLRTTGTRVLAKDWLLDPTDIIIASSAPSGDAYGDNDSATAGLQFNPSTSSTILASDIAANLNAGTNVTIATSSNGADSGNITVSSNISKTSGGAASLKLTAHNNIILEAGISSSTGTLGLTLNAAGTGGISGNASGTINTNGGVLTLNTANAAANGSLGGVISGAGAVIKTGSGTTALTGANSYSGATTVSGGTLQIGGGGTAGTLGTGTVTNNAMLTINRSNNITVANTITGTGGLTQSGSGTTTLSGNNSYGGGTTINAGTLASTDSSTALGTGPVGVNANGTLALRTTGSNQPKFANVLNGSGNITYSGSSGNQMFLSGDMSAFSGSFSINGTGTYIWFNNEGSQQAQFVVNSGSVMGLWSKATITGIGTGGINDGVRTFHAGSLTGSGKIQSDGGGTSKQINLSIGTSNQSDTFSGVIENTYSGGGNVVISIAKVGTGTQTLTGANTYTGTTTITSGTLQIGSGGTSGTLGTGAVTNNAMLTFNRSNNVTVANLISGSGGFTQMGNGTTTLTAANTFTGTTLVSGGTLALGHVNALQNSTLDTGTSSTQQVTFTAAGSTYNIGALQGADNLAIGANSISVGSNNSSTTYSGVLSETGSFSKVGIGTQILAGNNSYTGTTTVSGGTLQVGNAGSTGTLGSGNVTLSNNANLHVLRAADTTLSNTISGVGNVSASITGTGSDLSITGSVSLTGGTANLAADGNLSVQQAIATSNASDSAIVLTAGKPTNAGTSSGGDVSMSGSGSLSTGAGGRATIYTGSLSGSTGLGIATGNNRYNSDESSTNYSAALGSGTYAIYREKPTITVVVNDASKTYDGFAFSGGSLNTTLSSGTLARSDSFTAVTANATLGGASQGAKNAGQYAITASESGGKNALGYEVTYTSGQLTINQADLTVTANSATKTYDGTTSATGTGTVGTLAGAVAGDVVNSSGSQAFLTSSAGSNKTVRASGVTIKNSANADMTGNYNIIYTDNLTSTINKKDVTLSGITAGNKTYDGSTSATVSTANAVFNDIVSGDHLTVTSTGTFADQNAGNSKTVNLSNTLGGTDLANYTVTDQSTTTANITKKEVTLDSIIASNKTYDGSTTATITSGSIGGTVNSETLAISGSGSFDNKNVANSKTVTVSDVTTLTKADGTGLWSNYSLATGSKTTSANITPKSITLSGITADHKIYDGTTSATVSTANAVFNDKVSGDNLTVTSTGSFDNKNAGNSKTVTLSNTLGGTDLGNYTITEQSTTSANISKRNVTLDNIIASNKTYDGSTTATISSGNIGGTVGSETLAISGSGSFDNKNAADGKTVTVSDVTTLTQTDGSGAWSNYNLTTTGAKTTTANISKKSITLSGITAAHKTYDGNTDAVVSVTNAVFNNKVNGDTLTVTSTGTFGDKDVGNSKTVTLSNTLGGADLGNYTVTHQTTTTANITKKDVTLSSITAAHKTYDGNNSATISAGSISGTVASETLLISGSGTFDNKDAANGKTVTVSDVTTLTKADGTGAWSNYNLTTTGAQTTTANITKKDVTLDNITAAHKTYNGNTTATITSGSISGTVGSETLAISGSGTFDNKNVANGKTVTVADATTLTQTDGTGSWSNYNLTTTGSKTTTANITKADLTVTANSVTKTYDGTTKATGTGTVGTLAGAAAGDVVNSSGSQAFLTSGAGNNKTVRASGVTIKDAADADMTGNYNITYTDNTTGVIQKAELTVTANDDARFMGLTDTPGFTGVSPTGLVNGENMSVLGGTLSITRTNASTLAAGTYAEVLSPTGLTSDNYNITFAKGTYTIVPADQLLIRNDNISSTYGSTWSYAPTAKYLDGSNNTIITLSRTGSGNSFTFSDGLGTTVSATLNPYSGTSVANTSSAGHTVVGSYKIKDASPSVVGRNFVGDPVFVGTLNVNTQALTPSTSGVSMVYNGTTAMSNLSIDVTGKLGTDSVSIQGTGTYSQKHVGTNLNYTIANLALGGTDAANYHIGGGISSITGNDGAITPAPLKLSTSNVSKTYDGNTSASGTTIATQNTQLFGNDSLSGGTFAFSSKNASSGDKVVQVSAVTVNDGNNGQNYSVSYVDNTTSTISKKNVTLGSITAAHKTYDGSATATITSGSISGTVGSETLGISGSGNFDDKNVANSKTVTVSDVTTLTQTNGTGSWSNYNLTTTGAKTATANITPAAASISAPATSVIYNGQTQSQGEAVLSGFVPGDNVQAIGLASGRNAGSYASSLSATGADVGNYTITYNNAALTIAKRPASLSALGQTVVYNGQTQSLNGSQGSGFLDDDALTFGGLPSGRNVGQYTSAMTVSGADAANYDVTLGSATLTITPKGASVTARPERVTYNGQTQQQSPAVLEGFVDGDDIQISGLASGRNAGVYGSNVLASGQDVPNYSIRYEQGALTIDKAPLQFVGTSATSKAYDGNTDARVTAGTLSGLVGTETLNIDSVQGQFDSPEIGFAKPVQVVYGLSDGANGGLVSNYQWSPVTVQANITGRTTEHVPAPERIRQVNPFSRLSYLGFGGLVRTGAATGQLFYAIQNKDTRTCSPLQLEGCICEQPREQSLQVCYPAQVAQQAVK